MAPRFGIRSTRFVAWSLRSASRTGVRLTPNLVHSSSCWRWVPGGYWPVEDRRLDTESDLIGQAADQDAVGGGCHGPEIVAAVAGRVDWCIRGCVYTIAPRSGEAPRGKPITESIPTAQRPPNLLDPARVEQELPRVGAGGRAALSAEQPRPGGGRARRRVGRVRRGREGGAKLGVPGGDRGRTARSGPRRDADRPIGQAGGGASARTPTPRGC